MLRGVLLLLNATGIPRLVLRLMLDPRVPLRHKLILPAAIVYLVSPYDIVPHILPGIDDVIVILVSLALFLAMAPRDVVVEHIRNRGGRGAYEESRPEENVIEGSYRIKDDEEESGR